MGELDARVAALTGDRRRLLDRLAAPRAAASTPSGAPAHATPDARGGVATFYDAVTAELDATPAGPHAHFLNYGYLDGDDDRAVVPVPERTLDRTSVKLVLETLGDCPIDGRCILDVGCGRGGTVATLLRYFAPAAVVGVDISPAAIGFCRHTHVDPRASFLVGDAQALPFAGATFDVVTNVESSHCYPDVGAFYAEVRRVLAPGGCFLYTDLLATASLHARRASLARVGLVPEVTRDVTRNVLASCDLVAARRAAAFAAPDSDGLTDFLAVPGSAPYEEMRAGTATYVIWRLRGTG
jgi:phthiocerol/phenolphthiocerol synthesis type-I polyketide synthase E